MFAARDGGPVPEDLVGLILLSFTLILLPVVCIGVARQAADGSIGVNASAGIRTRYTRVSDEAWVAGHQAALPVMRMMWPVAVAGLPAAVLLQLAAGGPTGTGVAFLALIAQTVVLIRSAAAADRAARSAAQG
jgi:hypothetical protein